LPKLKPKALIAWSSGKDSAFALHEVRRSGDYEIVGALTTVTQDALAWGRAATRALFDLVEHDFEDDVALPAARLVVRDSTGPIARSAPLRARPPMPGTSSPPAHRSAPSGRSGSTRRKS